MQWMRVIDVLLPHGRVRRHEPLVDREPHEVEAVHEGAALQFLEVGVRLAGHLTVEDLDPVEAHGRGTVDAVGDLDLGPAEVPEGIGRDADPERAPGAGAVPGGSLLRLLARAGER